MSRQPLYPHVPKGKEPLFPHQREVPPGFSEAIDMIQAGSTIDEVVKAKVLTVEQADTLLPIYKRILANRHLLKLDTDAAIKEAVLGELSDTRMENKNECQICNCAGELLALITAAEAMEHNYAWQAEGNIPQSYREPLAEIMLGAFTAQVKEKCSVDTSSIENLTAEAFNSADKARSRKPSETFDIRADFRHAKMQMSEMKGRVLDIAETLCPKQPQEE